MIVSTKHTILSVLVDGIVGECIHATSCCNIIHIKIDHINVCVCKNVVFV